MKEVARLRKKIDEIDEKILLLLRERLEISKEIGRIKREHGAPLKDPQREKEKYEQLIEKAVELGLDSEEVKEIYHKIIAMSVRTQENVQF